MLKNHAEVLKHYCILDVYALPKCRRSMKMLNGIWAANDRINVEENYEVEIWAKEFGLSPERLREVITLVGPSAIAVKNYLNQ